MLDTPSTRLKIKVLILSKNPFLAFFTKREKTKTLKMSPIIIIPILRGLKF